MRSRSWERPEDIHDEYNANAVALVLDGGRTYADLARNIGVHEMTLGRWVKNARDGGATPNKDAPLNEDEREELERLRQEIADARMQAESAKKAAASSAKDQQ